MKIYDDIPYFDGHNDVLLKLFYSKNKIKINDFIEGNENYHIDIPKINKANFTDDEGNWMKRCEDQTLMLPIINKIHQEGGGTHHIDRPCYLYRGYQKIGGEAHQYQQGMEKFIRDRGYIE